VVEAALERGARLPAWADEAPELLQGDEFYISAFMELSTCRQLGFGGEGQIPWTAMMIFADRYELGDMTDAFVEAMRALDLEYLQWRQK